MSKERTYVHFLQDILDAVKHVDQFIHGMNFEQFEQDPKTTFAVIRALEVIGEAAKNIPESVRKKYPEAPWREMAGMRDKLTHEYFGVSLKVVWRTLTEDLPGLEAVVSQILGRESVER
jgi:uncharacterized protein with HEPN domain